MLVETATWEPRSGWTPALPLPDGRSSLVLVFGHLPGQDELDAGGDDPLGHGHDPFAEVADTWAAHAVLGCATPGQLCVPGAPDAVAQVVVARFERTTVTAAHVEVQHVGGARAAGRMLAEALDDPRLAAVFTVGDGLALNGAALAAGFAEVLGHVPFSGGLAGDGHVPGSTWTLVGGRRVTGWVSAVGFVGDHIELGFGTGSGWEVLGPERLVTQSYGNVLYELDGKPALPLYRQYLGEHADLLPQSAVAFPLAVRDLDDRCVIRTVWAVNPATDSLRLAGEVPQGAVAQLMRAAPDRLVEGAHQAGVAAAIGREELAITVSCSGRRRVLGPRSEEEIDAALEALDPAVRMVGFYGLGAIAPADGTSDLHNETVAITTLRERAVGAAR